jgi:hypothetical protein
MVPDGSRESERNAILRNNISRTNSRDQLASRWWIPDSPRAASSRSIAGSELRRRHHDDACACCKCVSGKRFTRFGALTSAERRDQAA